ncbi:hypothetical protein DSO57_1013244 [Entomophthora muscae]|uniref:Uncharacterized protein n=1 Tax=Entomophthora muscae TaxID=34485 RepID=A0ACC2SIS0_9FUNG|nr:hypothetical protein DSO57_1013244 [Entomophthora muscae]
MIDSQSAAIPTSPEDQPHHEDALESDANEGSIRESSIEPDSKASAVEEEHHPNFSLKTSSSDSNYDEGFDTQPPPLLALLSASKRSEKTSLSPLSKEITLDNEPNIPPTDSPHQEFSQIPLDADSPQAEASPSIANAPEEVHESELVNADSQDLRVAQLDDKDDFNEETPFELSEDKQSRELPLKVSSDSASLNTIRSLPLDYPMAEESSVTRSAPAQPEDQDSKRPGLDLPVSKLDEDAPSVSDSIDTIPLTDMNHEAPDKRPPTNLEFGNQRSADDPPQGKVQLDTPRDMVAGAAASREEEEKYGLKPMRWFSHKEKVWKELWVLTQNENGPCPLIALCNVLILRGGLSVAPKDKPEILFTELIELLASTLLSRTYQFGDNPVMLEKILSFLPTLRTGLDVNIGFQSVRSFGESPEGVPDEMSLFGAFGVELVHGWVPDPVEDQEVYRVLVLGSCGSTYNEVMDFLVHVDSKSEALNSMSPESVEHDALVISSFLERTATQMTYHGLTCLSTTLPNDYLCVLFRNNHFLTLYKRTDGELYLLVTDSGYGQSDFIVWESLQDLDQIDSQFFTSAFTLSSAAASQSEPYAYHQSSPSHSTVQSDHNLALSLQLQEERFDALHAPPPVVSRDTFGPRHGLSYKSHSLSSPAYHGSTLAAHRRAISYQPGQEPPASNEPDMAPTPGYEHDPSEQESTSPRKDKQCIIS